MDKFLDFNLDNTNPRDLLGELTSFTAEKRKPVKLKPEMPQYDMEKLKRRVAFSAKFATPERNVESFDPKTA